jgi:hypothetical protein
METGPRPEPTEELKEEKRKPAHLRRRDPNAPRPGATKRLAHLGLATLALLPVANRLQHQGDKAEAAGTPISASPEMSLSKLRPTFDNPEIQHVAEQLHLEPERYFVTTQETMDAIETENAWVHDEHLLPVLAPDVYKYSDDLEKAAAEYEVPVNFLGIIATIESAGNPEAHSGADAKGLMQIVPRYHLQRFVELGYLPAQATFADYQKAFSDQPSHLTKSEYLGALYNPEASARVSAQIYRELIDGTRAANPELKPDAPEVYARAAAGYNGGGSQIGKDFWDMPDESQKYFQDTLRFIVDAELAARTGVAPYSAEVDALAYAYARIHKNPADYISYQEASNEVANMPDRPAGSPVRQAYDAYKAGHTNQYEPTTPALRIWMAGGEKY